MVQTLMRLLFLASVLFPETSLRASYSSRSSSTSQGDDGLVRIQPFHKSFCSPIVKAFNPLLLTIQDSDQAQSNLSSPLKIGINISRYEAIAQGQGFCTAENTHISIGLLKDGTKVIIKKSKDILGNRPYTLDIALTEVLASKLGRALFNIPTIPPIEILYKEEGEFEVRQYLFESRASMGERLPDQGTLWEKLCSEPAEYGREKLFIAELALFDDLFAFGDRRRTSYFFASTRTNNPYQNKVFYSMDYDSSFYDYNTRTFDPKKKGKRFIDRGNYRIDDYHEKLETELNLMKDSEGLTRSLGLYISLLPFSGLNLDLFISMLYMLRESSIWDGAVLGHYLKVAKFTPVDSIIADLAAMTIIRTGERYFSCRLKELVGCGLSFPQLFRCANDMAGNGDAFREFLKKLPSLIDDETVDIIIGHNTPKPFSVFDVPWAPLSVIRKLDYLVRLFPQIAAELRTPGYKAAVKRDPTLFIDPEGPLEPYSISVIGRWHTLFLNYYKGRTYDDVNHALQVCLYSNKMTQRLFDTDEEETINPIYSTYHQQSIYSWQVVFEIIKAW